MDFRLLNNAGRQNIPVWLEIRCTPVENSEKILTILRDISDTKSMQNEIVEARDWADKANTAKTRFLANMSHELRTPLNAIIGFSEILRSGMVPVNEVEKQQEYQGLINDSAQHLLHVLNDILDMSKIESGKYEIFPEKFDLVKVVHSVCAMLMPLAQKVDVKFNIEEPLDSFQIEADSKAVRQILINILSNAIKFTNPDTCIDIGVVRTGRSIEIMVRDYGNGISPECIDGLGQPFHQVDANKTRRHQGTGLGLSIVKGLIELHQGSINIESEVGHGTTVTVQLSQYQKISPPVPADAADSVIKINPQPGHSEMSQPAISRLVG